MTVFLTRTDEETYLKTLATLNVPRPDGGVSPGREENPASAEERGGGEVRSPDLSVAMVVIAPV